jgi:tetratricopeptide (TPR) repeat protein
VRACQGAAQKVDGAWNTPRRAAVRQAFLATGKPFANSVAELVVRAFDDYTSAWVAMHTDACEATRVRGEQSQEMLDLRMACLSDRLTQVKTLTDLFSKADAQVVERAASTVAALPALAACADTAALRAPVPPPGDSQTKLRVQALKEQLAQSNALRLAAKYDDGTRLAKAALAEAESLHYRPLEAEARLQVAQLLDEHGDYGEASRSFRQAFVAALEGRHDTIQAWAAVSLISALGVRQGHYEEAEQWAEMAEAAVKRVPRDDEVRGALYTRRARLREHEGKYEVALVDGKRALEEELRTLGPDHFAVAEAHEILARIQLEVAHYPESLDHTHRALAIYERKLGPNHPLVATQWVGIADAQGLSGQHEEALVVYRRALAVFERVNPMHPKIAIIYNNMGGEYYAMHRNSEAMAFFQRSLEYHQRMGPSLELASAYSDIAAVDLELNRWASALEHASKGLEVCEKTVGPQHDQCGILHEAIGEASRELGKLDEAITHFEKGIELISANAGSTHPNLVYGLIGLAKSYAMRGATAKRVATLERAVAIAATEPDPTDLAKTRFLLAKALWDTGERDRARALSAQAHAAAAGASNRDMLARIEAWQAQHRRH